MVRWKQYLAVVDEIADASAEALTVRKVIPAELGGVECRVGDASDLQRGVNVEILVERRHLSFDLAERRVKEGRRSIFRLVDGGEAAEIEDHPHVLRVPEDVKSMPISVIQPPRRLDFQLQGAGTEVDEQPGVSGLQLQRDEVGDERLLFRRRHGPVVQQRSIRFLRQKLQAQMGIAAHLQRWIPRPPYIHSTSNIHTRKSKIRIYFDLIDLACTVAAEGARRLLAAGSVVSAGALAADAAASLHAAAAVVTGIDPAGFVVAEVASSARALRRRVDADAHQRRFVGVDQVRQRAHLNNNIDNVVKES